VQITYHCKLFIAHSKNKKKKERTTHHSLLMGKKQACTWVFSSSQWCGPDPPTPNLVSFFLFKFFTLSI
jgi:hypothetical protein